MNLYDKASLILTPNGFKASKLYSLKPNDGTGDFTFSRTGTATRVNSSGLIESVATNVPRLNYPSGGGCPSILLEPARTNLILRSEEFDNTSWTKTTTTVSANAATAPDGTTNADLVYPSSSGTDRRFQQSLSITSGTTYTTTIYAKASGINWIRIFAAPFTQGTYFNVSSGTIGTIGTGVTAAITSVGNGWFRCSVTQTAASTGTGQVYINVTDADGNSTVTANGTNGVLFWGAQVEAGSYATSYIPTTTASVTRNAESATLTSASGLIGQTEGAILFDYTPNALGAADIFSLNGTNQVNNCFLFINSSNQLSFRILHNSSIINVIGLTITSGTRYKIGVRYKSGDVAMYVNGVQYTSTSTYSFTGSLSSPSFTQGWFGGLQNQLCKLASIYITPLTNAELLAYSQS